MTYDPDFFNEDDEPCENCKRTFLQQYILNRAATVDGILTEPNSDTPILDSFAREAIACWNAIEKECSGKSGTYLGGAE